MDMHASGNSVPDKGIGNRNRLILEEAKKPLEVDKQVGLRCLGNEEELLNRLVHRIEIDRLGPVQEFPRRGLVVAWPSCFLVGLPFLARDLLFWALLVGSLFRPSFCSC